MDSKQAKATPLGVVDYFCQVVKVVDNWQKAWKSLYAPGSSLPDDF
jgi:hypothetical protein